jgi:hypothetical protein
LRLLGDYRRRITLLTLQKLLPLRIIRLVLLGSLQRALLLPLLLLLELGELALVLNADLRILLRLDDAHLGFSLDILHLRLGIPEMHGRLRLRHLHPRLRLGDLHDRRLQFHRYDRGALLDADLGCHGLHVHLRLPFLDAQIRLLLLRKRLLSLLLLLLRLPLLSLLSLLGLLLGRLLLGRLLLGTGHLHALLSQHFVGAGDKRLTLLLTGTTRGGHEILDRLPGLLVDLLLLNLALQLRYLLLAILLLLRNSHTAARHDGHAEHAAPKCESSHPRSPID